MNQTTMMNDVVNDVDDDDDNDVDKDLKGVHVWEIRDAYYLRPHVQVTLVE